MSAWRERSKDSSIPTDHIVTQGVESAYGEREREMIVCVTESELTCVCLEREEQIQLHTHGPYCYPGVSSQRTEREKEVCV